MALVGGGIEVVESDMYSAVRLDRRSAGSWTLRSILGSLCSPSPPHRSYRGANCVGNPRGREN